MERNHTRAKTLILIPIIVLTVTAACLIPLAINYLSTGSDVAVVAFIFVGSVFLICTTLPCLVMSVVGTVFAARAKKEGIVASQKYYVIGMSEIILYGLGVLCMIIVAMITVSRW